MTPARNSLDRRTFLQLGASMMGLALGNLVRPSIVLGYLEDLGSRQDEMRARLLELVNGERYLADVKPLKLDDLACRVATGHAEEMASENFISHWGRDGRKPYHRYSFAGGIDATQENVASADNIRSTEWKAVANQLEYLHVRMHEEKPPDDGHRKAILASQNTHVGFGFALKEQRLRLVETYVAKYVKLDAFNSHLKPKSSFALSGQFLNPDHILDQVNVFYEPLPVPADSGFLAIPRSYSLPDEYKTLRPRLPDGVLYSNRTSGVIDIRPRGRFRCPITLYKSTPGIYTIVFWIKTKREKPFPATEICIEAS